MKNLYAVVFGLLFLATRYVVANIGPAGFYDFPNYYFVETGTYQGEGVSKALKTQHFTEIYSMDIDKTHVENARVRYRSNPNIRIVHGDSAYILGKLISSLNKPITFWLDAHNYPPDLYGGKNTPILEELNQIKSHPIKTHTIIIDDMHCCNTASFDFITKEQIIKKIIEINPDYIIEYVSGGDSGEHPNNVLVARLPRRSI